VIARADDGERLDTVATLDKDRFGAASLERPALVRTADGGWRIYLSCATPGSCHWWIEALDAPTPEALADADARTVFPGDERTGVKDRSCAATARLARVDLLPPARAAGEEDRMTTAYATNDDGLAWRRHGTVLAGRPGRWDARGARLTAFLPDGRATYDGRATKEENFRERTGLASPDLTPAGGPVADVRYLDVLPLENGGLRLYYEAPAARRQPRAPHRARSALGVEHHRVALRIAHIGEPLAPPLVRGLDQHRHPRRPKRRDRGVDVVDVQADLEPLPAGRPDREPVRAGLLAPHVGQRQLAPAVAQRDELRLPVGRVREAGLEAEQSR
jgi:hypothetical protein